jgi:DNA-binding GntR family transcriptional regulator
MKTESLVDLAKRYLQLWIVKGEYRPSQKLKEEEIAARLGISRPPIREAFKALEVEGLVVRKPRRGVFVSEMTGKDVWEAYTLKASLYELSAELAVGMIPQQGIDTLKRIVDKMETTVHTDPVDLLRYQQLHQRFHRIIMEAAGNERLKKFSDSLHNQVSRFSYRSLQNQEHLAASVDYHRRIVDAMECGDRGRACRLMKKHVLEALDVLMDILDLKVHGRDLPRAAVEP